MVVILLFLEYQSKRHLDLIMDDTKFDHLVKKVAFGFKQHILFAVVVEYLFIYLSPPGLSCSMQDPYSLHWNAYYTTCLI